jgi:hypothetical protein
MRFFVSDLFVLGTLFWWLLSLVVERRRLSVRPLFLSIPVAGLAQIGAASVAVSVDPPFSFYHALRLVMLARLYLFLLNQRPDLGRVAFAVALQVTVQAVVGMAQVLQQRSLGLQKLGELVLVPQWSGVSVV